MDGNAKEEICSNAATVDSDSSENAAGLDSASETDPSEAPAMPLSLVRLLANDLESRYSAGVRLPTQLPPTLQSCSKIAALQDSLISKVQGAGSSKTLPPMPENCPKVNAVRDSLVRKAQVPQMSKMPAPTLQTCPKITALRETLISRVQGGPGTLPTSRTLERDLSICPSVASRQNTLLDVARRSPVRRSSSSTASFPLPQSVPFNCRDASEDGLPSSTDEPEMCWPRRVDPSDGRDELRDRLSSRGEELEGVPPNDKNGPKWAEVEGGLTNRRKEQENGDGLDQGLSKLGDPRVGEPLRNGEKLDERLYGEECGDVPENAPSNCGDEPDINSSMMSNSVLSTDVHCDSATVETLPESRRFV